MHFYMLHLKSEISSSYGLEALNFTSKGHHVCCIFTSMYTCLLYPEIYNSQFPPIIYHVISIEYKDNPMNIQWVKQHELCLLPCCGCAQQWHAVFSLCQGSG